MRPKVPARSAQVGLPSSRPKQTAERVWTVSPPRWVLEGITTLLSWYIPRASLLAMRSLVATVVTGSMDQAHWCGRVRALPQCACFVVFVRSLVSQGTPGALVYKYRFALIDRPFQVI